MKKTVKHYLDDLEEYISRVKETVKGVSEEKFSQSTLVQDALLRQIEVIGEVVKRIPDDYKKKYPKVPWRQIAGARDKITHDYDGIDWSTVWEIAQKDILELEENVKKMLEEEKYHEFEES